MTVPYEPRSGSGSHDSGPDGREDQDKPVIRDHRKVDPVTGKARVPESGSEGGEPRADGSNGKPSDPVAAAELTVVQAELAERTDDLKRLQAEYQNYRKRVDRDRDVAGTVAIAAVVTSLIPVLDDIDAARRAGDLTDGPFASIADKLEETLSKLGVERYGAEGDIFDPTVHEALLHSGSASGDQPEVTMVIQPGYRMGDRILRAAQVAVSASEDE